MAEWDGSIYTVGAAGLLLSDLTPMVNLDGLGFRKILPSRPQ